MSRASEFKMLVCAPDSAKNCKKKPFSSFKANCSKKGTKSFDFSFKNCTSNDILSLQNTACPERFRFLRYLRRTVQKIAKDRKKSNFSSFEPNYLKKRGNDFEFFFRDCRSNDTLSPQKNCMSRKIPVCEIFAPEKNSTFSSFEPNYLKKRGNDFEFFLKF